MLAIAFDTETQNPPKIASSNWRPMCQTPIATQEEPTTKKNNHG